MDKPLRGEAGDGTRPSAERVWSAFVAVLASLPPATRAVFLLHAVFDASDDDIEWLIGVRRGDCRDHVEAARRRVREFARANNDQGPTQ